MVDPIKKILLKHPSNAFINQRNINEQYLELNYLAAPNFNSAISGYEKFVDLLKSFDIEIHYLPKDNSTSLDSIYTHDPCVVSNKGVVICNMGKKARQTEVDSIETFFHSIEVPILGGIHSPGTLEGGDVVWINEKTIAIGEGY